MICPSCGNINPSGKNFCSQCSQPLDSSVSGDPLTAVNAAPYGLRQTKTSRSTHRVKRRPTSWKRVAIISALAAGIGLGIAQLIYLQWNHNATELDRQAESLVLAEQAIGRGLLVSAVQPSSPAAICGLQAGDIIIRYGTSAVEDITSYAAAAQAQSLDQRVVIVVFRGGKEVSLTAPSGYLGFLYEDWNPARRQIYERLAGQDVKGAAELAVNAEREGSLTDVQTLIVKIMLIPNRSSKEKEQERSELVGRLFSRYPMMHVFQLASSEFFRLGSYAAAARCYEEHLARFDKDYVNARLNLALCNVQLFEFDKAEQNVKYVVDRPNPGLSPYGVFVAHQVLGGVALGRNKYQEALTHALPYLETGDDHIVLMCLLAAAKLGDLEKFNEIRDRAAAVSAESIKRLQFDVDTLSAYVLAEKGKDDAAVALVLKWGSPQCIVDTAASHWDTIPGGSGIAERMRSLVKIS